MMKMMKKIGYWLLLLMLVLGCVPDLPVQPVPEDEGYPEGAKATVHFSVSGGGAMPGTKALGETPELDSLYLAVFGSSGYLKEYVKATIDHKPSYVGADTIMSFYATLTLSDKERSVHFIGNGPSTLDFGYDTEILPQLLSAGGGQAFWQMKKNVLIEGVKQQDGSYLPTDATNAQFANIPLIRNFSKIVLVNQEGSNFTPDSFAVFSVPAKGSVVPFHDGKFVENYQDKGFTELIAQYPGNLPDSTDFMWDAGGWDTLRVEQDQAVYLYERPKPTQQFMPTYVIVHGIYNNPEDQNSEHNNKSYYYKIDLMQDGEYYPILRNFKYQIKINKILSIGHTSAQAAAASAGSADVSADITTSHLSDISDGEARLVVQPWMSQTFNKRQVNNNLLHVKFFSHALSGDPEMSFDAVTCEIRHVDGQEDIIESASIGYPVQASGTEKGWRTVTFTTAEPGAPGTPPRTQALRIKGTYENGALYRDVLITLQPLQQFQLSVVSPDDTGTGVPRDTAQAVQLKIGIPTGLAQSMFPLNLTIEPEDMSLTPDNQVSNNNLPVSAGTSISDHADYAGKRAFQFIRTLTYDEYLALPQSLDLDGEPIRTLTCYFKTTRKDNATTIWVANDYFSKARVAYSNEPATLRNFFYIDAREENIDKTVVKLQFNSGKLEYQKNSDGWSNYTSNSELRLKAGDRVYFRGSIKNWYQSGVDRISVQGYYNVGGNIASLFCNDFSSDDIDLNWGENEADWSFREFFRGEDKLVDASALVLPMKTLPKDGYYSMFEDCHALTAAPVLPADTMAESCYRSMFQNCIRLTASPVLRADVLAKYCYYGMFSGCSSLDTLTMIATDISANNCLTNWVSGVASTGDFYGHVKASIPVGVNGVPSGWVDRNEFYVEAVEDGTVSFDGSGLQYSKNWEDWTSDGISSISVEAGDIVRFRGVRNGGTISSTGNFNVAGNILSLAAEDYTSVTTGTFEGIFKNSAKLVSAGGLVLPTTLQPNCFKEMFSGCTSLTAAPALSAPTLAANCYQSMFAGCTSLTAAPQLPAETLVENCYVEMFRGCSLLEKVDCSAKTPLDAGYTNDWLTSVAATGSFIKNKGASWQIDSPSGIPVGWTVSTGDYFKIRATSTTTITFNYDGIEYSLDEGVNWEPYDSPFQMTNGQVAWIRGNRNNYKNDSGDQYGTPGNTPIFTASSKVYISGNIMSLLADKENLSESAFQGAFSKGSSTALTYIDIDNDADLILPATTMAPQCYMQMFRNCTSLTKAPVFTVESTAYRCCYNMFRQCSNLEKVSGISLPAMTLAEDCYRELFRQCTKLTSVSTALLPATTLAPQCYQQMFNGCTVLTQAPALPAMNLATSCYQAMFSACTSLEQAPDLPATALTTSCYRDMFNGCTKLSSLRCLAETGINNNSTMDWMKGAKSTGTFYQKQGVTWPRNTSGIPSGWTVTEE